MNTGTGTSRAFSVESDAPTSWHGLRVLVVSYGLYPPNGGGELSLLAVARHLQSAGASVEILYHGATPVPGFKTHILPEAHAGLGMWTRQVLNYRGWRDSIRVCLRSIQPDLILTQQEASAAAVEAARREGVRSTVMIRGTDFLSLPERGHPGAWRHYLQAPAFWEAKRLYLEAVKRADTLIANSEFIRQAYQPLTGRTAAVVYPAVEMHAEQVNRMGGHLVMLSPHAHKGGHVLLETARRMPETQFVVAGNGEPEIVEPLRRLPNVDYRGWMADPEPLFQGACATLVPTQMPEAFGRVALESMAHGVPVIASDCGGLPEALGRAGVLVPEWDQPETWTHAVRSLMQDQPRYEQLSGASIAQARSFDATGQMRRFDALVQRTLESQRRSRVSVAGVPVDPVTLPQACREIQRACADKRRIAVSTVNAEFVVQSRTDASFRDALCSASLAVPDSFGIVLALTLRGLAMPRCPGVELTEGLAATAVASGMRLFFLGSAPDVLEKAVRNIERRHPGIEIGSYAPPFGDLEGQETQNMIAAVNRFQPDVLFVAFGAPRQEIWIARNLEKLDVHAAIGVGGSFDMISGRLARCPSFVGRIGMEWAYRLILEPTRWRRCLRLLQFLPLAVRGQQPGWNGGHI